jgi:hypothetical protein
MTPAGGSIGFRGAPTDEEIAAVLAAISGQPVAPATHPYEQWRRVRIAAIERTRNKR